MRILIVGLGSIGERHLRNIISLGYKDIVVVTSRGFKKKNYKNVKFFKKLDQALSLRPKVAFICNITSKHVVTAIKCAKNDCNLFIEKPLSHNLKNVNLLLSILKKKKLYCYVGYMMRFHPFIIKIKNIIDKKSLGELLYFKSHWGELVSDWHPKENYKRSYSTNLSMGGGPLLTLSHDIDLALYFINSKIKKVTNFISKISNLKINSPDTFDLLIKFTDLSVANIHVNYFEKPHKRSINMIFQKGKIFFNYYKNSLEIFDKQKKKLFILKKFSRNRLFLDEIKFYFDSLKKNLRNNNIQESIKIIKIATNK